MPGPAAGEFDFEGPTEKRADGNDGGEHRDAGKCWLDGNRANDIAGNEDFESEEDRASDALPVGSKSIIGRQGTPTFQEKKRHPNKPEGDDENASEINAFSDEGDQGLQVRGHANQQTPAAGGSRGKNASDTSSLSGSLDLSHAAKKRPIVQFSDQGDFLTLLLGVLILGLTMPADFCPSDAFAPRLKAVHWLETGRLGVDPKIAETVMPGQYFVRNPETGLDHPKYGLLHTMSAGLRGLLIVNISHLFLALTALILVGRLAALFTASVWIRVVFVLVSAFSTLTWFYLRAQTLDLIQMVLVLGRTLPQLYLFRFSAAGRSDTPGASVAALATGTCFGLALLTKPSHALFLPIATAGVSWATGFPRTLRGWKTIAAFVWPAAALTPLFFVSNEVRFGSAFDFECHHWKNETDPSIG